MAIMKKQINTILNNPLSLQGLRDSVVSGSAAVQALTLNLEPVLNPIKDNKKELDYYKQWIGKQIRSIMEGMGYSHYKYGKKVIGSSLFNVGSVYITIEK